MSEHTLGDAPIESKYRELMNDLAYHIDRLFNGLPTADADGTLRMDRKTGFVLLTFDLGDDARRCNYISNAKREDIVVLLREQLRRFEGAPDVTGHG